MPRKLLQGLAADVRGLFAAGMIAGDDRALARRAMALRPLGARVPALAVLADAIDRVRASKKDDRARALLDLNVLLLRLRTGLATAGLEGTPEPVDLSGPWTTDLRLDEPVFANLLPELADPSSRPLNALIHADHEEMGTELRLVGPLLAGLKHPDKDGPRRVASILPQFGKSIAPELRRDFDPEGGRADAMRLLALGQIDPEAARAACRVALAGGSDIVRRQALETLQAIDPREAEQATLALLAQPSTEEVRDMALRALRVAVSDAALDALLGTIDAPDRVWWAAAEALKRCPHPAAGARLLGLVKAAVADDTAGGLRRALRLMPLLIERRDADGLREFLSWIDQRTKELRDWARNQIQYLYEKGEPVVPELVATLRHKDTKVLTSVMESLMRFGGAAAAAVPRLIELLRDKRAGVREKAATTLGTLGASGPDAVAALTTALRDASANVRWAAAGSLGRCGPAAAAAVPALTEALNDARAEVCSRALEALGQVGPAAAGALPAVLAQQDHQYASVRHEALGVIARLGEPGVAQVVTFLRDRTRCAKMISVLSRKAGLDPAIVRELVAILRDPAHPERARAAVVLGEARPAAAATVEALVAALDEDGEPLREAAAHALVVLAINAKEAVVPFAEVAVPALARAVKSGPYRARVDACRALEHLEEASRPAIPALTAATNDVDFIVRQCAREALRAVAGSA